MAGGLAFDVVGQRKDQFADLPAAYAVEQRHKIQLFRTDSTNGREFSMEDVIDATMCAAPLQCGQIRDLFDHTDDSPITRFIRTDCTQLTLRKIAAMHTPADGSRSILQRSDQLRKALGLFDEEVKGDLLRRAIPKPWQLFQQMLKVFKGRGHESGNGDSWEKVPIAPRTMPRADETLLQRAQNMPGI